MAAKPGNQLATTHAAYAPARIGRVARAQKRRWLARSHLTITDLTGVQQAYLASWATCAAKTELLDRYFAENGLLDEKGEPLPATKIYTSLQNSARLAMRALEASLKDDRRGEQPSMVIEMQRRSA